VNAVQCNDFEWLAIYLQIEIPVCGRIHDSPETSLARCQSDTRTHSAIYGENFGWRSACAAATRRNIDTP